MDDDIKKILEAGCQAPSGSNSQPWKFRVKNNVIEIISLPEKDHPILNYRYRGTWMAHGALIENIAIAASHLGYQAQIIVFPDKSNPKLTARIVLEKSISQNESLYKSIFTRTTNRKPYERIPLKDSDKTALLESIKGMCDFRFTEESDKLKIIGEAVAVNEIVLFENRRLHDLLFEELVWTKKEERQKGGGLYLKTMELKLPQQFALMFFRQWGIMKIFNKFGVARSIAKDNAKNYASSSLMGIVVVRDNDEDFISAGKLIERLWLEATRLGLSAHLITGIFFFWQGILAGETKEFSKEHLELIENAHQKVASAFGVNNGLIAGLLRIGYDGEPSARSIKKPPEVEYI